MTGLSPAQLDTPYREGGWTIRQVVHHVPESHMNAYIRFKLALTETDPVIKPYDEAAWARLNDVAVAPVETSLRTARLPAPALGCADARDVARRIGSGGSFIPNMAGE